MLEFLSGSNKFRVVGAFLGREISNWSIFFLQIRCAFYIFLGGTRLVLFINCNWGASCVSWKKSTEGGDSSPLTCFSRRKVG